MFNFKPILMLFVLLAAVSLSCAIEVLKPVKKDVQDGGMVIVGVMGPGQTVEVLIKPKVATGGIYGEGGDYDKAVITSLPYGWKAQESEFYGDPLQVKITADKNAPEGDYYVNITIVDEQGGEKLDNLTFTAKLQVSWDVLDVEVSPQNVKVGASQPARIYVTVTNKGTASDTFDITITGIKRWEFAKNIYVSAGDSKTILWETVENERETYIGKVKVVSTSSPGIIKAEKDLAIVVVPQSVLGDYKATNNGIIVFPIFEGLVYSLAGLLSNLF